MIPFPVVGGGQAPIGRGAAAGGLVRVVVGARPEEGAQPAAVARRRQEEQQDHRRRGQGQGHRGLALRVSVSLFVMLFVMLVKTPD